MTHNATLNTAIKYFNAIGNIIISNYWNNPTGLVEPVVINYYLNDNNLTLTQSGASAHSWVMEQLNYAKDRWYSKGPNVIAIAQQTILEFYKSINYEEYMVISRNEILNKQLIYYLERLHAALAEGDEQLANFASRKSETIAAAISKGVTVKSLEENANYTAFLDKKFGEFNPFLFKQGD